MVNSTAHSAPKAEIIAVGSELLTPFRLDTNSLFLTRELNDLGITLRLKSVVGDDEENLEQALKAALARAEVIILTGGLGPTEDDITRKTVAMVLGRQLVLHEDILDKLKERFARRAMKMPDINARQALVPVGAIPLDNPVGTAPGLWIEEGRQKVILLPGPPRELQPMFRDSIAQRLTAAFRGAPLIRRLIKVAGMPESLVDQHIAPIYSQFPRISTTILAAPGQIEIHISASSKNHPNADAELNELQDRIEDALGEAVFCTEDKSLEEVVGIFLGMRNATIAVAESCTGGLIAKRLTDIPGSSNYFLGGVVCYCNQSKIDLLGVEPELLASHGAVSSEVACAMAAGVRRRFASSYGLSVTGIAGPSGGSPEKPVGLVYLGWDNGSEVISQRAQFTSDREGIRHWAAQTALNLIRKALI
jgi:nicotinamide-nucleotide amidase